MSNTQDEFYRSYSDETITIPNCLAKFFELDSQIFRDGNNINNEELRAGLEGDFISTDEVSGNRIVEYTNVMSDCLPPPPTLIVIEDFCERKKSQTAWAISRHLLPDDFTQEERNQWRFVIRDVVKDCVDKHDCIGCIDQSCILEGLEEFMGETLAEEMRVEYLALLIGLHDENKEFMLSNPDLVDEMLGLFGIRTFDNCRGTCGGHAALNTFANIASQRHLSNINDINNLRSSLCDIYTFHEIDDPEFFAVLEHPYNSNNIGLHITLANWDSLTDEEKNEIKTLLPQVVDGKPEEVEDVKLQKFDNVCITSSVGVTSCPANMKRIAFNPNRNQIEDLTHGFPGDMFSDGTGITNSLEFLSAEIYMSLDDDYYFEGVGIWSNSDQAVTDGLRDLFEFFTAGSFEAVAESYTDLFRENTSVTDAKTTLEVCRKVAASHQFQNWFSEHVLVDFNEAVMDLDDHSNVNNVAEFITDQRLILSKPLFSGLKILINDTEQTNVYITDYTFNEANNEWTASFCIEIQDHFGVDRADIIRRQYIHNGFAKWWVLQHQRNYLPFEHSIFVNIDATGTIN